MVAIVYGSRAGLRSGRTESISQGPIPHAAPESGDRFGWSLAAGNFDGDGYDDLAISAPFEDKGSIVDVGAVSVVFGRSSGLYPVGRSQTFVQDVFFGESAEAGDVMGRALLWATSTMMALTISRSASRWKTIRGSTRAR